MDARFYKTDENSFIRFEWKTVQNNFLTEKEGRPVFDQVLMGYVSSPGQQKSTMAHEFIREDINGKKRLNDLAYKRFGKQAEAFIKNESAASLVGTPVDQWKDIDMKTAAQLKALNIHTVEAMAGLSDTGLGNLGMGGRQLQAKAKAYIEASKSKDEAVALAQRVSEENERIKDENAQLRTMVDELNKRLSVIEAAEIPKQRKSSK